MTDQQDEADAVASSAPRRRDTFANTGRIVVGMDGSVGARAALEWSVQEARLRGGSVHAVVVWQYPQATSATAWGLEMDPSIDPQRALAAAAADAAARLGVETSRSRDVTMTSETVEGHPAQALLTVAGNADLLVVGSRGHGGFVGALLGWVSHHVVAHARCPVVVIPTPERHDHPGRS